MLNDDILNFVKNNRVCVLAVEMPDGSPHAATVHYAQIDEPLMFIIQTNPGSRKAESLYSKNECRVSLVIGLEEKPDGQDTTFQVDGVAKQIASDAQLAQVYFGKFPDKQGRWPDDIFMVVEPNWWRYTDWRESGRKPLIVQHD